MAGYSTNGLPTLTSYPTNQLQGWERTQVDTYLANGTYPQSVSASAFSVAAVAAAMAANASTESGNAVTSNVLAGTITTASLSTAAAGTYVVTLTNSTISATSVVRAHVYSKSNTTPGATIAIAAPGSGSVVFTITNGGTAALNGTMVIPFMVSTQ